MVWAGVCFLAHIGTATLGEGLPAPLQWSAGNLASNPSFELGLDAERRVRDWRGAAEFPDPTYELSVEAARSGQHSVSISNSLAADGTYANGGWHGPAFPTVPRVVYALSGAVNPGAGPSNTYMALAWFDANNRWLGNTRNGSVVAWTNQWVSVAVADEAPDQAAWARAYFRSDANGGVAYCDDVRLEVPRDGAARFPFADGDLEARGEGLWEAKGPGAVWVESADRAHTGRGCLALQESDERSAWVSALFGTGTIGEGRLALRLFVDTSGARAGRLDVLCRWQSPLGDTEDGEAAAIPLAGDGYQEIDLALLPPQGVDYGQLVLQVEGLRGVVYVDDVSFMLTPSETPQAQATARAIACAYMAGIPTPDIAHGRFEQTFPDQEERTWLAEALAETAAPGVTEEDRTLGLFLAQCRYHAADYEGALALAKALKEGLSLNDVRRDLAHFYAYHASRALAEERRRERVAELDARAAQTPGPDELREIAKAYEEAQAPASAAGVYDALSRGEDADIARWAAFRAGMCWSLAGEDEKAIESLRGFLAENAWTRWAPEATVQLGESFFRFGRYDEAIEALDGTPADADLSLRRRADGLVRLCYRKRADTLDGRVEYEDRYGAPPPELAYVGSDETTQGDWPGVYGRAAFILCAMASPRDMVGGYLLPTRIGGGEREERMATTLAWADSDVRLPYTCSTGDPAVPARLFLHVKQTEDRRALFNPVWGARTFAIWDDRGELHPFDGHGPDLHVRIEIPPGGWVVSLYFLDWDFDPNSPTPAAHTVTVTDLFDGASVGFQAANFGQGVYHSVALQGPMDAEIRVNKDESLCAGLAALFLDPISAPLGAWEEAWEPSDAALLHALDLCKARPVHFAQSFRLPESAEDVSPADALAAWRLVEALPRPHAEAVSAAGAWLAALRRKGGAGAAVARGREALQALLDSGDLGPARALTEGMLDQSPSPELLRDAARWSRIRDLEFARSLLDRYAQSPALAGERQRLLEEALDWSGLAEEDRREGNNMRRTTFILAELILRHVEAAYGEGALGEEGLYALACSRYGQNWFDMGWGEAAIELERFLDRYPESSHVPDAVQRLARCHSIVSQGEPRDRPSPTLARTAEAIQTARNRFPDAEAIAAALTKLGLAHETRGEFRQAMECFEEGMTYAAEIRRIYGIEDLISRVRRSIAAEGGQEDE